MHRTRFGSTKSLLIKIRWAAILGQALVFFFAKFVLDLNLDSLPFFSILTLMILSNLFFLSEGGLALLRSRNVVAGLLLLDVGFLTAMLYSYGGYTNPFSMVYLVQVVFTSMILGSGWAWAVSVLSSLCYSGLFYWYVPVDGLITHQHAQAGLKFNLHLQGMLVGFVLISILICLFLQRLRSEIDRRDRDLEKARNLEEKLAVVTTLSASVAHELGTPLGSMMFAVDDLKHKKLGEPINSEIDLLDSQLNRCKDAVSRLTGSSGQLFGENRSIVEFGELYWEALTYLGAESGKMVRLEDGLKNIKVSLPRHGFVHVIVSLIKNAVEASPENDVITVSANRANSGIEVKVTDRGTGMDAQHIARAGEPFFSTKDSGKGMGLGLFIVKLFSEKLGGNLRISSRLGEGTEVILSLPNTIVGI